MVAGLIPDEPKIFHDGANPELDAAISEDRVPDAMNIASEWVSATKASRPVGKISGRVSVVPNPAAQAQYDTLNRKLDFIAWHDKPRLNFVPCADLRPATGYGKLEIALATELHKAGVDLRLIGVADKRGMEMLPEELRLKAFKDDRANISLMIGRPELGGVYPVCDTRCWLYTMSESTRVSDEWVRDINAWFERVIVTAPDLVQIYKDSGVTVPVHYVSMGITPPEERPFRMPRTDGKFTFLGYSLGDMRKAAEHTIMAFKKLFGDDPRFQLWIKSNGRGWIEGNRDPQIKVISEQLSERDWYNLLASADCFVFPSRGEGFGLPPREATLVGTPTIATQWLGMHDVDQWGYPINVLELRPAPFEGGANHKDATWGEPNEDHLVEQMRYVVDHYDEALAKADAGRHYLQQVTWAKCAAEILDLVAKHG